MTPPKHPEAEARVFRRAAAGDRAAVDLVVRENMGLVGKTARYYSGRNPHIDLDDLMQVGVEGLLKGISKFDVDRGYRFSTYATYWIRQTIQRYCVSCHSRSMSSGKSETEKYMHGTADAEMIEMYELRCFNSVSLNGEAGEEGELSEIIANDEEDTDELAMQRIDALELGRILTLVADDRDAWVVTEYHGLFGRRPKTMREIGEELGITSQGVRAILERVMVRLREEYGVED